MDEELKALMRRDVEISEESLKILRSMRRAQRMAAIFTAVKWVFIIAVTFGTYYLIQPFLDKGLQAITDPASLLENPRQTEGKSNIPSISNLSPDTIQKIKDVLLKGGVTK